MKTPIHARCLILIAAGALSLSAQRVTWSMTAEIRGGGGEGKCTLEVWVDDVAEVEIRGRNAVIRTVAGGPASFRRFQCNQEMPLNPAGFRFKGIDGRGRQNLLREPQGRTPAVIRIEDSKGGGEGYTFDIFWSGSGGSTLPGGGYANRGGWSGGNRGGWNDGWGTGGGWISGGAFDFEGGRRGAGEYRDRNGNRRRLDQVRVSIDNSGNVSASFEGEQGRLSFTGRVDRREGRRVVSRVSGSGANGILEIEMSGHNQVRQILMRDIELRWSN